jgi:hypothetical protein
MAKTQEVYTLEDLHSSISDLHYQLDEGKITRKSAYVLSSRCCLEFLKNQNDLNGECFSCD